MKWAKFMNYNQIVEISANQEKIFKAITQSIEKWWGPTDLPVTKIGDEFTTRFDETFWKFKIIEFQKFDKITWECIDAKHIHSGYENIEKEWIGTSVHWSIESLGLTSKIIFTHTGLTPELNCYDACKPAWDMFITKSLKSFVETGIGMPYLS